MLVDGTLASGERSDIGAGLGTVAGDRGSILVALSAGLGNREGVTFGLRLLAFWTFRSLIS